MYRLSWPVDTTFEALNLISIFLSFGHSKNEPMSKGKHFYSILLRHYGYCFRNDLLEEMLFHNVAVPVSFSTTPPLVNIHDLPWAAFFPWLMLARVMVPISGFTVYNLHLSPSERSWSAFTLFYLFSRIIRSSHQALEAKCTNEYFNHVGRPPQSLPISPLTSTRKSCVFVLWSQSLLLWWTATTATRCCCC